MNFPNNHFTNIYETIEKGSTFFTVWAQLPEEITKPIIQTSLSPLQQYCIWISTYSDDQSKNKTHISLRYLGYETDELREKVKKDVNKFKEVISGNHGKLELGDIVVWKDVRDGELITARLSWEIKNKEALVNLHNKLLTIPGYSLYRKLEGENYSPHISLGVIYITNIKNLHSVQKYLKTLSLKTTVIEKFRVGVNLTSKDKDNSEIIILT